MADFIQGDTASTLSVICRDTDGVLIDLTGHTVTLRWRYTPTGAMSNTATMTNANQTTNRGKASRLWAGSELIAPEIFYDIKVTETSSGLFVTQLAENNLNIGVSA